MSASRWLVVSLICSVVAAPAVSKAQTADTTRDEAQDFAHDVLGALFGRNWNLFAHGGFSTADRFLLQQATTPPGGERALQASTGYNVGGGAGVDILLRMGFRASYTYSSSSLNFKTDNGDGSDALDNNDVATIKTHTAALEVIRYMLPARATINPYGTVGIQGTWWALDSKSALVSSGGASNPLSVSPLFAFGVQFVASEQLSGRMEAIMSGGRNPFAGNSSYRAFSGPTIDEPTGISRTDYRFAVVYHFGRPGLPAPSRRR